MLTLRLTITGRNAADLEEALHDVLQDIQLGYTEAEHADAAASIKYEVVDEPAALAEVG